MAPDELSELERSVREIPGVLGCVVLANADGTAAEIQAFARAGVDREAIERAIVDEAEGLGAGQRLGHVFVFELDAESHFGDRDSLLRAAELAEQEARSKGPLTMLQALGTLHSLAETAPGEFSASDVRPPLRHVLLSSSTSGSEAQVTLGTGDAEVVGQADGAMSSHGAEVVAKATLKAAMQLEPHRRFTLAGVSAVPILDRDMVVVVVEEAGAEDMLGAALVRDGPLPEAAVRATLDAINRRLARSP